MLDDTLLKRLEELARNEPRAAPRKFDESMIRQIKYHEAGHAVASILNAAPMGFTVYEALEKVTINDALGHDGAGGATYSKTYSRPLYDLLVTNQQRWQHYNSAQTRDAIIAAGVNLDTWGRCTLRQSFMGAAAQAKSTGQPFRVRQFHPFPNSIQCCAAQDFAQAYQFGMMAFGGLERLHTEANAAETVVEGWIERPDIWAAVSAVADSLQIGENSGVPIVRTALKHIRYF